MAEEKEKWRTINKYNPLFDFYMYQTTRRHILEDSSLKIQLFMLEVKFSQWYL
jgi:hypothetical protein